MMRLNPTWKAEQVKKLEAALVEHKIYEMTISLPMAKKWVIFELDRRSIPFKVHNLGAGVAKITTDTDTCPCCKRKL